MSILFFTICFLSSIIGSICGIGGGVIIKPVLDAAGIMSVSAISFMSGCSVLAMSLFSVLTALKDKTQKMNMKIGVSMAMGAAAGGIIGKSLFQYVKAMAGNEAFVGFVQAVVLILMTVGTFIYTVFKKRIRQHHLDSAVIGVIIGVVLGIMSSFLGIGGGPINLVILEFCFAMTTKEAARCSLFIIMLSQMTSLMQSFVCHTVPEQLNLTFLGCMIAGSILGAYLGKRVNKKISDEGVNKLFMLLMLIIICINVANAVKFGNAM